MEDSIRFNSSLLNISNICKPKLWNGFMQVKCSVRCGEQEGLLFQKSGHPPTLSIFTLVHLEIATVYCLYGWDLCLFPFPSPVTCKLLSDSSQVSRTVEVSKIKSADKFEESRKLDGAETARGRLECEPY